MITYEPSFRIGSTLEVAPLGLGAWSWGDRLSWNYGKTHTHQDVQEAYEVSIQAGIEFIDTAEVYGFGQSERLLGSVFKRQEKKSVVCTKFFPFPWRLTRGSLKRALKASLKRLGLPQIDLYLLHWPTPPVPIEIWMQAMAEAQHAGLIKEVGVSNFNLSQMRRAQDALSKFGIKLAANQVRYSLIHRTPERNGLLQACRNDEVVVPAYSPLGQGLLTGKYFPGGPQPQGPMRARYKKILEPIQPVIAKLNEIGDSHDGKSPAQVALNWVMSKGVLPIPGAKNKNQAMENAGSLGWALNEDELLQLEEASEKFRLRRANP